MKIIFAGTPDFALAPLQALHEAGYEITVLTQPDKPQGRKGILTPSPVKTLALSLGLPVLQPEKLKEEISRIKEVGAELMVTCAYGQILTQEALNVFPKGVWNIHASLLPAYRGAAPIPRVIIDGEKTTGVTIMKTDVGLDTGDILCQEEVEITSSDTYASLSQKLSLCGAELIVKSLPQIAEGNVSLKAQGEGFVCKKVQRAQVDFSRSADEACRLIRGLSPAPLAYATVNGLTLNLYMAEVCEGEGARGEVLSDNPKTGLIIACGQGAVNVLELQPSGGKRMTARDFLNGRKVVKGARFDQPVL